MGVDVKWPQYPKAECDSNKKEASQKSANSINLHSTGQSTAGNLNEGVWRMPAPRLTLGAGSGGALG
jgi:hypothetical protein